MLSYPLKGLDVVTEYAPPLRPSKVLVSDEIDAYPSVGEDEGDAIELRGGDGAWMDRPSLRGYELTSDTPTRYRGSRR